MSTMYTFTRQEVAESLWISTRSVDRYIKSWKLRSKKEWKIVYVNDEDVKNLWWDNSNKQEIIVEKEEKNSSDTKKIENVKDNSEKEEKSEFQPIPVKIKEIELKSNFEMKAIERIYDDLKIQIKEKDEVIQDLSLKLWRAEEIVKNSVSMIDFKRSQMLLEDSKTHLWGAISDLKTKNDELETKSKNDKKLIVILFVSVVVLFAISFVIWFINIWK